MTIDQAAIDESVRELIDFAIARGVASHELTERERRNVADRVNRIWESSRSFKAHHSMAEALNKVLELIEATAGAARRTNSQPQNLRSRSA